MTPRLMSTLVVLLALATGCGDPPVTPAGDAGVDAAIDAPAPRCGDGALQVGEACDDGNATSGDGCDVNCTVSACGNGVTAGGEGCDDGDRVGADGCSATCAVEPGYVCDAMIPAVCATVCGDGVVAGAEACDQGGGDVTDGDGCSSTCTLEAGWTCTGTPSACVNPCGNGLVDPGEQCDDGNLTAGDGCAVTCQFDIGCPAGSTQVVQRNLPPAPVAIPNVGVVELPVTVAAPGAVTRVVAYVERITHPQILELTLRLVAPSGQVRRLRRDVITLGFDYLATFFDDAAPWSLEESTPPYTGRFRPFQTLATAAGLDLLGQNAAGVWKLQVVDVSSQFAGTWSGWSLIACVDPALPYCGDGVRNGADECDDGNAVDGDGCSNGCQIADGCGDANLDAGEQCDDGNAIVGDGCSATCTNDLACAPGETAVRVSAAPAAAIPPLSNTGIVSTVTAPTVGAITRLAVQVDVTEPRASEVTLSLIGPSGVERRLISANSNSDGADFRGTQFADGGAVIEFGVTGPYTGRYAPSQSLASAVGVDFRGARAAGTWGLHAVIPYSHDGTLERWTLMACVQAAAPYCGDGVKNGADECDDGNAIDGDGCSNLCQIVDGCGDGNLDTGEPCDDGNAIAGDGCSATCALDIGCAAGEVPVVVRSAGATAIPDNGIAVAAVNVGTAGLVRRAIVGVNLTHPANSQVRITLLPPRGVERALSGSLAGANQIATLYSDAASTYVGSGAAPFTGAFRPIDPLVGVTGLGDAQAAGDWRLAITDSAAGMTGSLTGWSLALCVDPGAARRCGNGVVEDGEACDDGNRSGGDGCAACQLELGCGLGETAVRLSSTGAPLVIPDANATGVTSTVTAMAGTVRKAVVGLGTISHRGVSDLRIDLTAPIGPGVSLTTSGVVIRGAHFVSTVLDDGAATSVGSISSQGSPHRGRFRPLGALAALVGGAAGGAWQLRVADVRSSGQGFLQAWSLGLCVQ